MNIHPDAGKPPTPDRLVHLPGLVSSYYTLHPDAGRAGERVAFGTSGHRGSSLDCSFNEDHVLAICQAVTEVRREDGTDGPLFLGMDTHALSEPALRTAVEVFAAHDVMVVLQDGLGPTPTPVVSRAILRHREETGGAADGVVITPSHNPPEDGGLKYNPPTGGPARDALARRIEARANEWLESGPRDAPRIPWQRALQRPNVHFRDYLGPYVTELAEVVDLASIAAAGLELGADPLGGSGTAFWEPIAQTYGLRIEVVDRRIDPTFGFMPLDRDGRIRMDCSSPWAMSRLIGLKDRFDVAFGNDPDFDRHGIVTRSSGLLAPNHFLAVAVDYLFRHREAWTEELSVGKTLVSSSMIDRVAADLDRNVYEVPVGFKWFVDGLLAGRLGLGGEESAGASFLRRDGSAWTTDKDGFIMDLLAAEITAVTGRDPGEHYRDLETRFGVATYERIDAPVTGEQKKVLAALAPDQVEADHLAGDPITATLTRAPGNDAPIGGLKVVTERGWFAARPSGTEEVYKIYAESFAGEDHLRRIQLQAQEIVAAAFRVAGC
jgi:phosphoglucomutase